MSSQRFIIESKLGEGGMGAVYEAVDRERNARVALKRLLWLEPQSLLRFKAEFRRLQDIHHRNLVSLGELVEQQGEWFLTMELVRGVDFLTYVRQPSREGLSQEETRTRTMPGLPSPSAEQPTQEVRPPSGEQGLPGPGPLEGCAAPAVAPLEPAAGHVRPFHEERLRQSLLQLARGLCALHRAGKVHRDIKPSNILVTEHGRVVLLDFGILADVEEGTQAVVLGTPTYMAPEQSLGQAPSPSADWYSVGVLLYQALTGKTPFSGSARALLAAKRKAEPVPPQALVAGLPEDLARLCVELLQLNPNLRPLGAQVLARLGDSEAVSQEGAGSGWLPFVGRERELRALHQALEDSRQGASVLMWVQGESGVGKTRLVNHFLQEVRQRWPQALVLSERCYERESVPYKGVDGLIDSLARYLTGPGSAQAWQVITPDVAALGHLFPVLWEVEALAAWRNQPVPREPVTLRLAGFLALRSVLERLAQRQPLLLVVDDWQWADRDSEALLQEVVRAQGLLVVGTLRVTTGELTEAPWLGSGRVLELEVLEPQEAQALVERLTGMGGAEAQEARRIAQESGGHPLFVDALVRSRRMAGDQPLGLEQALWARASLLEDSARQLLGLLAVADGPLTHPVAAQASGLSGAEYMKATSSLRGARLAMSSGPQDQDTLEVVHDKVRKALLPQLGPEERRQYHHRLAIALEVLRQGQAHELALHWGEAGQRERAAAYHLEAARNAARALAFSEAASQYRRALELGQWEPEARRQLWVELAESLRHAGRGQEAAEAFLRVAQGDSLDAWVLRRRAAEQYLMSGALDKGLEQMQQVLRFHRVPYPKTSRAVLGSLVWQRLRVGLRLLRPSRASTHRPVDVLAQEALKALGTLAQCLSWLDPLRSMAFNSRYLLLAHKSGQPRHLCRALASELILQSSLHPQAAAPLERLVQRLEQLLPLVAEDPVTQGCVYSSLAVKNYMQCRFLEAWQQCQRARELLHRGQDAHWELGALWSVEQPILLWMGELQKVRARRQLPLAEARQRGDLHTLVALELSCTGQLQLQEDDVQGARQSAEQALALMKDKDFGVPHFNHLATHLHVDLYEGRGAQALGRLTEAWPLLKRHGFLRLPMVRASVLFLRARASLLAASEPGADGQALLRSALADAQAMERSGLPAFGSFAQLVRACLAARRGAPNAPELCERAATSLEAQGLGFHAACLRWCQGTLLGGAQGRALLEASQRWMSQQGIRRPQRMLHLSTPGVLPPP